MAKHRILSRKDLPSELFVHHRHAPAVAAVTRVQRPPAHDPNLHRAKVIGGHDPEVGGGFPAGLRCGPAFHHEASTAVVSTEWQHVDEARRTYAWHPCDAFCRLLEESSLGISVSVAVLRQRDGHGHHPVRVEAGIQVLLPLVTLDQQSRGHQQHRRQRHFQHYQRRPEASGTRRAANAGRSSQRVGHRRVRGAPRRHHAEDQRRDETERDGEAERRAVQPQRIEIWQRRDDHFGHRPAQHP
jgi:hypothetical protein